MEPSPRPAREGAARLLPLILALVALAVRAVVWSRTGVLFNDGPAFIGLAHLIALGEWNAVFAHPFHPLYPLAIVAAHGLGFGWESAAVAVSAASGALAVAVLFGWLRAAFDARIATLGALLLAFHPVAAEHSADVQSDGLYALLFLASVAALWTARSRAHVGWACASGALAGLAYWVRPEGLGVAVIGVAIGAMRIATRRWSIGRGLPWILALAIGAAVVSAPYIVVLHEQSGRWLITRKKTPDLAQPVAVASPLSASVIASEPFLETVVRGSRTAPPAPRAPSGEPRATLGAACVELLQTASEAMHPAGVVLVALGILFGIRPRLEREGFIAIVWGLYAIVLVALVHQAGYVSKRHALPVSLLLFGYAAAGASVLGGWGVAGLRAAGLRSARSGWSSVLGVAVAIAILAPSTFEARRADRVAERRAAEWLALQPGAGGRPVAAGKQRVAYYARAPHVRLPDASLPDALASLRALGAEYLIVDDHYLEELPSLRRASEGGMRAVHRTRVDGTGATVYSLSEPISEPEAIVGPDAAVLSRRH